MIRKTVEGHEFESQMIGELHFDKEPVEGSFNPVTSDGVAKIAGDVADLDAIVPDDASEENKLATASDVAGVQADVDAIEGKIPSDTSTTNKLVNESGLQDAIDNASESWSTGFTPKGESSVSDLNDLATQSNGDSYIVTDSGTLTDGSLAVVAGDQVAWDATNSVWYKLPQYALKQFGTNAIKNLPTTIASFRTGDVIAVDGPSGTANMPKDTLLELTAQNALAGNVAQAFVPNSTTTIAGHLYMYNGSLYMANEAYQGLWDADKFVKVNLEDLLSDNKDSIDTLESAVFTEVRTPKSSDATISDKYIGSSGNLGNASGMGLRVFVANVTAGEKYIVKGTNQAGDIACCYAVYSTRDSASMNSSTALVVSSEKLDSGSYELVVTIPTGGVALAASNYIPAGSDSVTFSKLTFTDKIQKIDNDLGANGDIVNAVTPDVTTAGGYFVNSSNIFTYDANQLYTYQAYIVNVTAGEAYKVKGVSQAGVARCWAVYSTADTSLMDADHLLLASTKLLTAANFEETLVVPDGGVTLVMSCYRQAGSVVALTQTKKTAFEQIKANTDFSRFRYSLKNNRLIIGTKSGEKELVVSLFPAGRNQLMDFRRFGKIDIGAPLSDIAMTLFQNNVSDWIGPFIVAALSNKDGDDTVSSGGDSDGFRITFTGGSHQYNNQLSGSTATARMTDLKFRVNGKAITEGYGYASVIEISWTSYIQGYNTKKANGTGREILKENVTMRYDGVEWDVMTELVPLEDVALRLWYGYQMTGINTGLSVHWKYINGTNRGQDALKSGNDSANAMLTYGGNCNVEMYLDRELDMGNGNFFVGTVDNAVFESNNKGYFMVVNEYDPSKSLLQDNHYFLHGRYRIYLP